MQKQGTAQTNPECLFHCPNLQGVILGIGLATLEEVFAEEGEHVTPSAGDKSKSGKRRKADIIPMPHPIDQDDDDDDDHYPPAFQAKKMKLCVGYAGDVREGVSPSMLPIPSMFFFLLKKCCSLSDMILDFWASRSTSYSKSQGWETCEASKEHPCLSSICSSRRWGKVKRLPCTSHHTRSPTTTFQLRQ